MSENNTETVEIVTNYEIMAEDWGIFRFKLDVARYNVGIGEHG